jgi:hypothetical protein
MTNKQKRDISNGFDAGNYASAYETTCLSDALERLSCKRSDAYRDAFILGFLSTYELHEMGSDVDAYLTAYHSEAGRECLAAGYVEDITEAEVEALFAGQA